MRGTLTQEMIGMPRDGELCRPTQKHRQKWCGFRSIERIVLSKVIIPIF
jgi:hypothetical protein